VINRKRGTGGGREHIVTFEKRPGLGEMSAERGAIQEDGCWQLVQGGGQIGFKLHAKSEGLPGRRRLKSRIVDRKRVVD